LGCLNAGLDNGCDLIAGEAVIDIFSDPVGFDQLVAAQPGQMLGNRGLTKPRDILQLAHGFLSRHELTQDQKPVLAAHAFK
jgi:hypothetical protein